MDNSALPLSASRKAQAQHMVLGQLHTNDIVDKRILAAMATVPREQFVPALLQGAAYVDDDLQVAPGRFLLEPLVLARLLDLATITPQCRVLLIGGLHGYAAAVLARVSQHVTVTELEDSMIEQVRRNLAQLGIGNVDLQRVSSLAAGYAPAAPYDVIIIAGAVCSVPDALGQQLATHGRLATVLHKSDRPGISGGLGKGVLLMRSGQHLQTREHFDASAPLLPGFMPDDAFRF